MSEKSASRAPGWASKVWISRGSLRIETRVTEGRTYAAGLTQFEPTEMDRLLVPVPELLLPE